MKKVFGYILTFVLVFTIGICLVKAEDITIHDVRDKLQKILDISEGYSSDYGVWEVQGSKIVWSGNEIEYKDGIYIFKQVCDVSDYICLSSSVVIPVYMVMAAVDLKEQNFDLSKFSGMTYENSNNFSEHLINSSLEEDGFELKEDDWNIEFYLDINRIDTKSLMLFFEDDNDKNNYVGNNNENSNDSDKDEAEITFVEPKAKPENITIKEIAEKLPSVFKKVYSEQFGELVAEDTSNFSVEYDYNTITIYQEIDEKIETLRTLTINDGVITHEYIYDTELGIDGERIVNIFIYKGIFMTIGEIYGYSEKELEFLYSQFFEATFDEYGYEFTSTKEKSNFKIDINRFNLEKEVEEEPNEEVQVNNDSTDTKENSNSSTVFVVMIIIVIVSLCLLFYINRDMFGNMLRNKFRR